MSSQRGEPFAHDDRAGFLEACCDVCAQGVVEARLHGDGDSDASVKLFAEAKLSGETAIKVARVEVRRPGWIAPQNLKEKVGEYRFAGKTQPLGLVFFGVRGEAQKLSDLGIDPGE